MANANLKVSVVRGGSNYWILRRKVYSPSYRSWVELSDASFPSKALASRAGRDWLQEKREQNPLNGIKAQVRRLPSGEVQIKVPLRRGENPMVKARQVAKALGRKITSVARMNGGRMCNPAGAREIGNFTLTVKKEPGSGRYNLMVSDAGRRSRILYPGGFPDFESAAEYMHLLSEASFSRLLRKKGNPAEVDTVSARELELYVENDADLYRQQYSPINKNLATKKARGIYRHDLAVKLFMYLMESGAKKYAREFGGPGASWHEMFNVPTRRAAAERFAKYFEVEYDLGNYDRLLPKKYQKKANPAKAYWQYPWTVVVGPGTKMADVYSRGFNTEKPARAYAKQIKRRVYHTGVDVKILHNTGTNLPGGVKEYTA